MTAEKKKASQTDTVESYDEAFLRIKRITGTDENDIDRIVNKFIQDEDQNFALFNFVNDQNNKIEILQEQIEQVGQKCVVVSHKKDFHLGNNYPYVTYTCIQHTANANTWTEAFYSASLV